MRAAQSRWISQSTVWAPERTESVRTSGSNPGACGEDLGVGPRQDAADRVVAGGVGDGGVVAAEAGGVAAERHDGTLHGAPVMLSRHHCRSACRSACRPAAASRSPRPARCRHRRSAPAKQPMPRCAKTVQMALRCAPPLTTRSACRIELRMSR